MDGITDKLNSEQLKPVCDTQGHVLVLAGAGSGKTRVLTSRIAYILDKGLCAPSNILAITFTNKAAKEMRTRLEDMLGDLGGMWICTIHAMCVKILRRFGESAGIKSNFSIYSDTERNNIIKKAFQENDFDDEKLLKSIKFHIGNAKMLGLDPDQYALRNKDEKGIDAITKVYESYNDHLRRNNALDFDDLLLEAKRLLSRDEEARQYLSDKFKYILVDEFQDTNTVQYAIIKLLASVHGNLFVVGDDDQSIYGWRGAEIDNILKFDSDYPDAKVYKLERNYRSTKSILELANTIIGHNDKRRSKQLWTEAEEGFRPQYVEAEQESDEAYFAAKTINAAVFAGAKYSDFAVLMRINALTRSYEQEFTKYSIPYKVFGGFRFFERKEIKDMLAYLRLISNPFDDEALVRIINVPKRGVGSKTMEVMQEYADGEGLSLYDACLDAEKLKLTQSAKSRLADFANTIKELIIRAQGENIGELVRDVISLTAIKTAYDDGTDEGDGKLANIDEFIAAVDDFVRLNPDALLDEYLNQVTLSSDTDDMDDGNYVTIATIHSVKGLEFDNVFICGLEDGIMPTSRAENDPVALEEERRLMYVAITRARKCLWLTRSRSRYLYGRREPTAPSKFIRELSPVLDDAIPFGRFQSSSAYRSGSDGYGAGRRNAYGSSYGNSYGNSYTKSYGSSRGGYGLSRQYDGGYDGDFWSEKPAGRAVYSSDDGYVPDVSSRKISSVSDGLNQSATKKAVFSASSSFSSASGTKSGSGKSYSVGMKVKHPKFGHGTVISLKNGGSVIDVAFENQGIKELSASLAPLEILR